jgi:hypothetical protein
VGCIANKFTGFSLTLRTQTLIQKCLILRFCLPKSSKRSKQILSGASPVSLTVSRTTIFLHNLESKEVCEGWRNLWLVLMVCLSSLECGNPTQTMTAPLSTHLDHNNVEFIQFAFRWMNCLLMREISVQNTIRMWDTYLVRQIVSPDDLSN